MSTDPYQPIGTDGTMNLKAIKVRSRQLVSTAVTLLALATLCFFAGYKVWELTEESEKTLDQLGDLAHMIETRELTLKRESLIDFFDANQKLNIQIIETQTAAYVFLCLIGFLLVVIAIIQFVHLKRVGKNERQA